MKHKKSLKKSTSLLLTFIMLISLLPFIAFAEGRIEVNRVVISSENGDIAPEFGNITTHPKFNFIEGRPAYFPSSMEDWYKKVGDDWIDLDENDYFTEGTYRYSAQLRIDDMKYGGNDGTTHVLPSEGLTITVDGVEWEVGSTRIESTYSYVKVYSPEYSVTTPKDLELTFFDSSKFDIGRNYAGHEITTFSVAANVVGGTAPYTFSKVSGPAWISVSSSGKISGIPNITGKNSELVVKVTDSKNAEATITIAVANTKIIPEERTKISVISAITDNGYITPKYGETAKNINFTVIEGQPSYFASTMGGWYKKTDDSWTELSEEDTFIEGTYRYSIQVRIDEFMKYDGKDGTTHMLAESGQNITVDGSKWDVNGKAYIGESFSWVWVYSPEFTVTKPVIQAISINGITTPIAGKTANTSGITTNNKGITLNNAQWYKQSRDSMTVMGTYDKFELNKTYYLVILYNVAENYEVSDSAEVLHNLTGGKATHNSAINTIIIEYKVSELYTVTIENDGNGTANANVARAPKGTNVKLTAKPNDGYEFDRWEVISGDVTLSSPTSTTTTFTIQDSNIVVKAIFKESLKTISGTVYSSGDEYTEIILELYDNISAEPIKTLTLTGTDTQYLIKNIESGTYTLKVIKEGHTERNYCVTVENSTIELNITINRNGDANMDNELDSLDYQQVVNAALRRETASNDTTEDTDYINALCDYDGDGCIDVIDCALIARIISGGV